MNIADLSTTYKNVTIPDGDAITEVIELEYGQTLIGIFHPVMDTSVVFGFEVSPDGITYSALEDGAGAPLIIAFDSIAGYSPIAYWEVFRGFRFLKIAVADNQTGDKVLKLAVRPT